MSTQIQFRGIIGDSIDISPESLDIDRERLIRVKNELDLEDLSNLHTSPSATYVTTTNTVAGLADAVLRHKGLVPSWITDWPITDDNVIQPSGIFLDRICGTESHYQLNHPNRFLEGFTPAIHLVTNSGLPVSITNNTDLSELDLSDYVKMNIGVEFTPVEMPTIDMIKRWQERYKGLTQGDINLHEIPNSTGEPILGAYSLLGQMTEVESADLSAGRYQPKTVYLENGQLTPWYVNGDSLAAITDKWLGGNGIYKVQDTFVSGRPDKRSNLYLVSVPGLEQAIVDKFVVVDPRDIGILIETQNQTNSNENSINLRTEPGEGRMSANEAQAVLGMKYDVVAMVQGVYNRKDHIRQATAP